jgi:hypothetical protein
LFQQHPPFYLFFPIESPVLILVPFYAFFSEGSSVLATLLLISLANVKNALSTFYAPLAEVSINLMPN